VREERERERERDREKRWEEEERVLDICFEFVCLGCSDFVCLIFGCSPMVLPENERVEDMRERDARGGRRREAIGNRERRETAFFLGL
jgi:hypothetical protein